MVAQKIYYVNKGNSTIVVYIIIALLVAALGVSVGYILRDQKPDTTNLQSKDVQSSESSRELIVNISPTPTQFMVAPPLVPTIVEKKVPVAFSPSGKFSVELKKDLETRLAQPFIDYNNDPKHNMIRVASITFNYLDSDTAGYLPVAMDAVLENGGTNGQLVFKEKGNEKPAWFMPECMITCTFSEEFSTKYPALVAEYKKVSGN
jgi:hypothetical protein